MRKRITAILLVSMMLVLPIIPTMTVQATTNRINYPEDEADVRVEGTLGVFDPGDPDPEGGEPPVTEWWLDVSLPTNVAFFSDQSNAPTSLFYLTSIEYDIHNYSGRGVDVTVENFEHVVNTGEFDMIDLLEIVSGSQNVRLITAGNIDVTSGSLLVEMERQISRTGNDSGGYDVEPRVASFRFDGLLGAVPSSLTRTDFDLTLGFEVNLTENLIEPTAFNITHYDSFLSRILTSGRHSNRQSESEIHVTGILNRVVEPDQGQEVERPTPPIRRERKPNKPGSNNDQALPQTGATMMNLSLIGMLALLVAGMGVYLKGKKK